MMITKIEKQKKDKKRYNIYFDGGFAFGLDEVTVLKFGLRTGDDIDEKKEKEIRCYDEFNMGKMIAYSLLSYKQRSQNELKKKLMMKKISEETIEKIIKLLIEQKYLDDVSYAGNYLSEKISKNPIGRRLVKYKLAEKGIENELIEKVVFENYSEEKEIELASELLKKYKKKIKSNEGFKVKNKCFRYLLSKGFDYETVVSVINQPN